MSAMSAECWRHIPLHHDARQLGKSVLVHIMFQEAGQRITYGNQYKSPSHTPYYNSIRLQAQELAHAIIPNVVGDGLICSLTPV